LNELMLDSQDIQWLSANGLTPSQILRQFQLLSESPYYPEIIAPVKPGDGVVQLDEQEKQLCLDQADTIEDQEKLKFIPASGAASRMFQDLLSILIKTESPSLNNPSIRDFFRLLPNLPFAPLIPSELMEYQELSIPVGQRILHFVLLKEGLGYYYLPKALIPFHRYPSGEIRTAFEEHIRESLMLFSSRARFHFTFSPDHQSLIEVDCRRILDTIRSTTPHQIDCDYSYQSAHTQTIAVTLEGIILRDHQNRLVLRAGGHGALLDNLNDLNYPYIMIKNIDNIPFSTYWPDRTRYQRILLGLAAGIRNRIRQIRQSLDQGQIDQAVRIKQELRQRFALFKMESDQDFDLLDRPLRIVSVIQNQGEPGGGVFWVRDNNRIRLQILEQSQIDPKNGSGCHSSLYFNPVDMVVSPYDSNDRKINLFHFRDDRQYLITQRSWRDQSIRILEYPGLWNGSMADYNTVCVETPPELFTPVKTVFDLLKSGHRIPSPSDFHGGYYG